MHCRNTFNAEPDVVYAFQTLHWNHPERYNLPMEFYEERQKIRDAQFGIDLESAREAGRRMANRIRRQ